MVVHTTILRGTYSFVISQGGLDHQSPTHLWIHAWRTDTINSGVCEQHNVFVFVFIYLFSRNKVVPEIRVFVYIIKISGYKLAMVLHKYQQMNHMKYLICFP